MFGKRGNYLFDNNSNESEEENKFGNTAKIFSDNGPPRLKSCLRKPMDNIFDVSTSNTTLNKSVRWKEYNEEFHFCSSPTDSKSTFDFQNLLDALTQFAENIRKSKEDLSDCPIVVERDHSLKKRIILLPGNSTSSSIFRLLNLKTFKSIYEKTYKTKIFFKYIPRKMTSNQWKRVDLVIIESIQDLNLENYKTKKGSVIDVKKSYPLLYLGVEGETYPSSLLQEGVNIYQFSKDSIEVNQYFCDYVKGLIERNRII
uniref:Uncharacterized protein n=1 Tax=Strongyloides venezuelensis TaxID=75913 RepID=A0A0K0FM84_STRVS